MIINESKDIDGWKIYFSDVKNNIIYIQDNVRMSLSENIKIKGVGNKIFVAKNSDLTLFSVNIGGDENRVIIGKDTRLIGKVNIRGANRFFRVGDSTTFQSVSIYLNEGCDVSIGNDCMFSARIEIRTSDSHSIYDIETGKRLNKPGSVVIGDHVWLGKEVIVSKNVTIGSNIIVGAKSFVSRNLLDEFCIYAGLPAKKVRTKVGWTRELLPFDAD
jgi:acetyltransferase-like isoleucine patch superfamily enzyme